MIKYFENDKITLYCGDSLYLMQSIETNSIDLVISDPPYGQNYLGTGFRKNELPEKSILNDTKDFDFTPYLAELLRVLRSSRHLYIFSGKDCSWTKDKNLSGVTELIWDKGLMGSGDLTSPWGCEHEKVFFAVNGKRYGKDAQNRGGLSGRLRKGSVLNFQRKNGSGVDSHLTEKPVELLREFIESSSMIGDTVLDCFAGSGSTLEAAIREDRKAIGIEISEKNCEQIVKRLRNL